MPRSKHRWVADRMHYWGRLTGAPAFCFAYEIGRAKVGSQTFWCTWGANILEEDLDDWEYIVGVKGFVRHDNSKYWEIVLDTKDIPNKEKHRWSI